MDNKEEFDKIFNESSKNQLKEAQSEEWVSYSEDDFNDKWPELCDKLADLGVEHTEFLRSPLEEAYINYCRGDDEDEAAVDFKAEVDRLLKHAGVEDEESETATDEIFDLLSSYDRFEDGEYDPVQDFLKDDTGIKGSEDFKVF